MLTRPSANHQIFPEVFLLGTEPRVNEGSGPLPPVPVGAWGAQS